jgi:hypothetical protein
MELPMRHVTARFLALTAASALAVASAAEPAVTVPPEPAGMTALFNGRDLSGWDGDPRLWSVRDGVIHGETTVEQPAAGNTFLICEGDPVRDFELRLSFRCTATNNSGIQYRSVRVDEASARNRWVVRGYQHELRNEERFPNVPGFIYDEGGLSGGRGRISAEEFEALAKVDEWNDVVIRAEGNRIRHWLNGRLILDFVDEHPKALAEGVIALQLHAGKPMWAEFRDIRLKRL